MKDVIVGIAVAQVTLALHFGHVKISENKETLDNFIEVMKKISEEIDKNPDNFKNYPSKTIVKKIDEVYAARNLDLRKK